MPLNPEEYNKVREQAVVEAEAKAAEDLKNSGEKATEWNASQFEKIIDIDLEVKAFYETAHKALEAKIKATNDPRLTEKLAELKAVYDSRTEFDRHMSEKSADEYWNALISTLEKDERANLQHGPEMMKTFGLPKDVEFSGFRLKNGEPEYDLKRNGMYYDVTFKKNGSIELRLSGIHASLDYYESESRGASGHSRRRSITQSVSLMELRDGSAFELHWQAMHYHDLTDIAADLRDSFGDLPKLSTKPKLKTLIERKNAMEALRAEIWALSDKQDNDLTPEQSEAYYQRVAALFKERLEDYYKMEPETEDAMSLRRDLYDLVYKNPRLSEVVLQVADTIDKMKIWQVGYGRGQYLHGTFRNHKEKLDKAIIDANPRLKAQMERMSDKHKEYLEELTTEGIITGQGPKNFLKYYAKLPEEILYDYTKFLKSKEARKILKREPKRLVPFTKVCRGMNDAQFDAYSEIWEDRYYQSPAKLKRYERVIRDYEKRGDVVLAAIFLEANTSRAAVRKLMKRAKKLLESKKLDWFKLRDILNEKSYRSDDILTWCEKLDKDYIDNHIIWLIEEFGSLDLKDKHFETLNALTPMQRKVFDYLKRDDVNCFVHEIKKFEKILEVAGNIKTEDEIRYICQQSYEAKSNFKTERGKTYKYRPSEDQLIELCEKAATFPKLWEAVAKLETGKEEQKLDEKAYILIDFLIDKSVPEETLVKLVPDLGRIGYQSQVYAIASLFTPGNLEGLVKQVAACESKYSELLFNGDLMSIHTALIKLKPNPKEIPILLDKLIAMKKNEKGSRKLGFTINMEHKARTAEGLYKLIEYSEDPKAVAAFKPIYESKEYPDLKNLQFTINLYFYLVVSIDDLKEPQKVLPGLKAFLAKSNQEKYDADKDPRYERAKSFLDKQKVLDKEDNNFTHIAFILNILQGSSPEFTKEKLRAWSLKNLDSSKEKLREKAAKLLIGLGTYTNQLKFENISKIAKATVDNKISKCNLSEDMSTAQLAYIDKQGLQVPLSVYFSMLINLEEQNQQKDQALFEKLVDKYKEIEKQPVYGQQLLVLAHDKNDTTHSYVHSEDSFNPRAHETMAKAAGAKALTLRHASENESVESMMSRLELTKGDLDIVIGGHGGKDIISFGREYFDMDELFARLAKRLERQKSGKPWKTQILFSSCFSSYNIELLMAKWTKDPRTKDHQVKMLSSSSEEKGSAKMADDSWFLKAAEIADSGRTLTWGELYRDIESRNFVMDIYGHGNSNMTLYENGKKYF